MLEYGNACDRGKNSFFPLSFPIGLAQVGEGAAGTPVQIGFAAAPGDGGADLIGHV